MKISKLFHWLYAFLMFLPVVLFIPNAFYYGFNEHATNSETTIINYKYQSNEVNDWNDLIEDNLYQLPELDIGYGIDTTFTLKIYKFDSVDYVFDESYNDFDLSQYDSNNGNYLLLYYTETIQTIYFTNENVYWSVNLNNNHFTFYNAVFSIENINGYLTYWEEFDFDVGYLPQYTDYNVIESVEINTNDTISNKMYQAWQSTWDLPLLSWTHDTFVAAPFTYITGLFGIGFDNTLNYVFAYFVSISICWLVFDLIMYVPNLAHRWLDRSALE